MIAATLVTGKSAFDRELAIAAELDVDTASKSSPLKSAILLEGLGDGKTCLIESDQLIIARIATGCLCCSNNMIMRIYLNRLIHQKPQRLFLSLSTDAHLEQIKQFFGAPDYAKIISLSKILHLS